MISSMHFNCANKMDCKSARLCPASETARSERDRPVFFLRIVLELVQKIKLCQTL
eukprot:COSAG04_NODE_491_length_13463_cov_5.877432_14_plen_55_part_00